MIDFDTNVLSFIKSNILDLMNWGKRKSSLPSGLVEELERSRNTILHLKMQVTSV